MRIKKQINNQDCALNVLEAFHHHFYKKRLDIEQMRKESNMTEKGINIQSFIELARKHNMDAEGFSATFESIDKQPNEYMVAIIENEGSSHFVIFIKKGEKYQIFDPAKGKYWLESQEFKKLYQQLVIVISKAETQKEQIVRNNWVKNNLNLIIWMLIATLVGIIFSFISTIYSKILFDKIIPYHQDNSLLLLTLGFGFIAFLRVLNMLFKKVLTRKIELSLEFEITNRFLNSIHTAKLLNLRKISNNDILRRLALVESVVSFISSGVFLIFNELVVLVVSTSLLLYLSPKLFAVTLLAAFVVGVTTLSIQFMIVKNNKNLLKLQMNAFETKMEMINSLTENKKQAKWDYSLSNFEANWEYKIEESKIVHLMNFQGVITGLINLCLPILLMYLSTKLIFQNQLSIGNMMLFLGLFTSFISPTIQLSDFLSKFNINFKNWKLVQGILKEDKETLNENGIKINKIKSISFSDFHFDYDRPLININKFKIDKNIVIKGKNGVGKSTLLKILNLDFPCEKLIINDIELPYYALNDLRNKICYIGNETKLISKVLIDQITLNDKNARSRFEENATKYNLFEMLQSIGLHLGLSASNGGENLSSGQKQVVHLLKLFAFEFQLVLLDEAFENVDEKVFKYFKTTIPQIQKDALFVEVSHSQKYIFNQKEVDFEEINSNK